MSYEIRERKDGRKSVKFYCKRNGERTPSETWVIPDGWSQNKINREIARRDADYCARVDRGEPVGSEIRRQQQESREAASALKERQDGIPTMREYTETFLRRKGMEVQPTTISGYRTTFNHINPVLGDYRMTEISREMINHYLEDLREHSGLEYRSFKNHFLRLQAFFEDAADHGIIEESPMKDIKAPRTTKKGEHSSKDAENVYTLEEVWDIMDSMKSDTARNRALIAFMLDSGCRRGEVMGLKWRDVDFVNNQVNICNNIEYSPERGTYETSPKNGKSRVISLDPQTLEIMRRWQIEQHATIQVAPDYDYCFPGGTLGKPMSPSHFNALFDRIAERHGFEDFRPHKLRHTSATLLIVEGKSDIASVSRRLGHSNISITLNTYCHAYDTAQAQAAKTMGSLIHNRGKTAQNRKHENRPDL